MSKNIKIFIGLMLFTLIGLFGMGNVSAITLAHERCPESYVKTTSTYTDYADLNSVKGTKANGYKDGKAYRVDLDKKPWYVHTSLTMFAAEGHTIYCTEHGVVYVNAKNSPSFVSASGNVDNNILARVLAYGYNDNSNSVSCSASRVATQMLVHFAEKEIADGTTGWRSLTASQMTGSLFGGSGASSIASEVVRIRSLVLDHDKIPSFAFKTAEAANNDPNKMELKYSETNRNFSNSKSDTNGVFSTYTLGTNPTSVTATKSGNTLTITSKDDSVTTPISMSKVFKSGGYYQRNGEFQNMAYIKPTTKTVTAYTGYKYEKIGKGTVKIHKIDKYTGKNMKGASFGIYSDADCTKKAVDYLGRELPEKKSDKNGIIAWDNLYYPLELGQSRTYYVKETKTIEGYALDNEQLDKLKAKGTCIPVQVTASEKDTDDTTTDDKGTAPNSVAPQKAESTTKEIEDKEVVVQAVYNIPYGNVTILKQDVDTGKVIPGVEFKLLKNNTKKEPATDMNGNVVKNAITDENGIAEFENIPYGDYILVEVKANSWYKILEEPIEFTLNKDNDALKYEAQGTEALPSTDSKDNTKQDTAKDTTTDKNASSTTNSSTTTDNKTTTDKVKDILIPLAKYRLGDPTNDGKINQDDMKVIEDIIAKNIEATSLQFYASDLNLDKNVDQTDKDLMQKYLDGDKTAIANALKEYEIPGQIQKRVTRVVTNKALDMKISKVAITNEKELPGAKIVVKNAKGEVFIKFTSTSKVKEFAIPIGDYTLTETVAPKGYQTLKTEVKFRVLSNGNIKLVSADSNMYKIVKSKEKDDTDADHLKIYNQLKKISVPNTGSVIAISTIVGGLLLIGGGSYVIYRKYKTN